MKEGGVAMKGKGREGGCNCRGNGLPRASRGYCPFSHLVTQDKLQHVTPRDHVTPGERQHRVVEGVALSSLRSKSNLLLKLWEIAVYSLFRSKLISQKFSGLVNR